MVGGEAEYSMVALNSCSACCHSRFVLVCFLPGLLGRPGEASSKQIEAPPGDLFLLKNNGVWVAKGWWVCMYVCYGTHKIHTSTCLWIGICVCLFVDIFLGGHPVSISYTHGQVQ